MNKLLRVWSTDGGFTVDGTNYEFDDFDSVAFTVGRSKHLMRGANSKNKVGIDIETGNKTPDTAVATILSMSADTLKLLNDCYNNNKRIDLWFIDRANLGRVQFNNAKLTMPVRQLNIGEEETNLTVQVSVESFDVEFEH